MEVACHQFEKRVENCIEAKAFSYIYQAFQLFIVMFCDYLLIDCLFKESEKDSHPDLLSLLIVCLVIKKRRQTEQDGGEVK